VNMKNIIKALSIILICGFFLKAGADVLQEIVVKEGDTLWSVANYYLKNPQLWPEILKYNKLPSSDPNVILPGMKLRVPILLIKENLRTARLIYLLNEVKFRRRTEADWKNAWEQMELYNEDGLRTLQLSKAKVKFSSGEILQLDENSLIILRPEQSREEIDLLSGGVRASKTRVLTSDTAVDPKIVPRGPAPDFKTKVKEDKTTLVEVYEGAVDVKAQGRTVTVTKGFGTEVKFSQPPSLPRALPPMPDMNLSATSEIPGTNIKASARATATSLELNIKTPAGTTQAGPSQDSADPGSAKNGASKNGEEKNSAKMISQIINKYHLQIATSSAFTSMVLDEIDKIQDRVNVDFQKYKLSDGIYFYRFAYVDELGFEGQFCSPIQFVIDTTPPLLEIYAPQDNDEVDTEFVNIEGKSEPWVKLKINEKNVDIDDNGKFISALIPRGGINLLTFIAQDRSGNITKKELTITKVKVAAKNRKAQITTTKAKEKGQSLVSIALGTLTAAVIAGVLIFIIK